MDVKKFMDENKNICYEELKTILEKEYKLKINIDNNNDYYMISTTNKSDFTNIFIRQCTGIILEKNTNNILHYFGERTYDINNDYNNNVINFKNINIKKCYITQYNNGYIIKIFNYKEEWKFATSKHTDIKYFKVEKKNLYNILEDYILKLFYTMNDFLNLLDKEYCYTFILNDNSINIVNKMNLNNLKEVFNFKSYIPLHKYKNIKYKNFIIIEKDDENKICKKIHASIESINNLLNKNA